MIFVAMFVENCLAIPLYCGLWSRFREVYNWSKPVDTLRPMKNSLRGSEAINDKSPRSNMVVVPAFLREDSSFRHF